MKRAAIGVRVHSGWGALVAVSGDGGAVEVIDRRRVAITDPKTAGAAQPYHFAEKLGLPKAEKYLAGCAVASQCLAQAALREVVTQLADRDYRIVGAAILLASGRPLPPLSQVLASHALIHTAEGEFFRSAFREAFERLGIRVTRFPERELDERAKNLFGTRAPQFRRRIAGLGRTLGPPWTADQKVAALVATMVLAGPA